MTARPSLPRRRQWRVLLALGWYDYRLHRGIEKYAVEHGWHLDSNFVRERVIPWDWAGDGVLAWLGAGDDLAEFVTRCRQPTVDFSLRRENLKLARVLEDHAHAAKLVAEHFLSRGFKHFLFYSDADNWSYEERGRGFFAALQAAGHSCQWLRWHQSEAFCTGREEGRRRRHWLAGHLQPLPKPLGVFAANDLQALDILEACEAARLAVPESVAIVGAENYLLAPDAMRTPISSVDTNLETLGYRGAELLDHLMAGRRAPVEPIRVPAAGVVVRKSSDNLAVTHPGVARALRYIQEHAGEAIGVEQVVQVAAMSRRGLHNAFMAHLGRTPGHELRRVRIERAKRLLCETDHKIEVVARQSGYRSANSFDVAFKQATGISPQGFRAGRSG